MVLLLPLLATALLVAANSASAHGLPFEKAQARAQQQPFLASSPSPDDLSKNPNVFLTPSIKTFITDVLSQWDSPGLSVAVVRRDPNEPSGWKSETAGYGIAGGDGRKMNADSLHGIASNS